MKKYFYLLFIIFIFIFSINSVEAEDSYSDSEYNKARSYINSELFNDIKIERLAKGDKITIDNLPEDYYIYGFKVKEEIANGVINTIRGWFNKESKFLTTDLYFPLNTNGTDINYDIIPAVSDLTNYINNIGNTYYMFLGSKKCNRDLYSFTMLVPTYSVDTQTVDGVSVITGASYKPSDKIKKILGPFKVDEGTDSDKYSKINKKFDGIANQTFNNSGVTLESTRELTFDTVSQDNYASSDCPEVHKKENYTVTLKQNIIFKYNQSTSLAYQGGGVAIGFHYINKLKWSTSELKCSKVKVLTTGTKTVLFQKYTGCIKQIEVYPKECNQTTGILEDETTLNNIFKKVNNMIKKESELKKNKQSMEITNEDGKKINFSNMSFSVSQNNIELTDFDDNFFETDIEKYDNDKKTILKNAYNGALSSTTGSPDYYSYENGILQSKYAVQTVLDYRPKNAYIKRSDGSIKYLSSVMALLTKKDYIQDGAKYFLDLDYTGSEIDFKFENDLSVIKNNLLQKDTIKSSFETNITVDHRYFNVREEEISKNKIIAGYAFIYRTIDLNNVFPNNDAGNNWVDYLNNLKFYANYKKYNEIIKNNAEDLITYNEDIEKNPVIVMKQDSSPEYYIEVDEASTQEIRNNIGSVYKSNINNHGYSENIKSKFGAIIFGNSDSKGVIYRNSSLINIFKGSTANYQYQGCGFKYNGIGRESDCG